MSKLQANPKVQIVSAESACVFPSQPREHRREHFIVCPQTICTIGSFYGHNNQREVILKTSSAEARHFFHHGYLAIKFSKSVTAPGNEFPASLERFQRSNARSVKALAITWYPMFFCSLISGLAGVGILLWGWVHWLYTAKPRGPVSPISRPAGGNGTPRAASGVRRRYP